HWGWALRGAAHRTAARLIAAKTIPEMVLAMPSDGLHGKGSGYLQHSDRDCERWIVEDVPAAVRLAGVNITDQSPQFICGLSMGGYGALRLGAKYSKQFR